MGIKYSAKRGDVEVVGYRKSSPKQGGVKGRPIPIKVGTWVDRPGRGYAARQAAKKQREGGAPPV